MIIVKLQGGLGNQMFQYAVGRALSLKYNVPLGLDLSFLLNRTPLTFRSYDLDVFNIHAEIVSQKQIPFFYRSFKNKYILYFRNIMLDLFKLPGVEKSFNNFNINILNIGKEAYLDGFWQSPKYFSGIEDIIRKDFILKNSLDKNIQMLTEEIESTASVCIFVRRTDYISNSVYEVVDINYYERALEYLEKRRVLKKIYVFSDDIEWCKKNLSFKFPTMFVDNEYAGEKYSGKLFLMSKCNNFIIPNSTFSWWAAWLNPNKDKIVIVPKKWFSDATIDTSDLIPEEWISF